MENKNEQQVAENNTAVAAEPATNNEPPVAAPEPPTAAPEPPAAESAPAPRKNRAGWILGLLALLVALLAIAASVYLWQLQARQQQLVQGSQAAISGAIQRVDEQTGQNRLLQRQLDRQVDSAKQQQQQLTEQMDQLRRQLSSQQKRLASLSTTDRNDWLLAEAEYLVRLANQRLLMGKEVKGALDLLTAADEIARELDDAALYNFRQALAEDMAALRSADKLDIEGVYLQLGAVAKQVDRLRLFERQNLQLATPEATPPQGWQQQMQSGIQAAWQKLRSYIQIKRRDEIYQPLLAPEYEAAVRQNVRLMFEQAQMSALAGKQRLYEDSLNKAKHWLRNYYTLDQSATAESIRHIDELAKLKITVPLPDISGSLRALKSYLEMIRPNSTRAANKSGAGEAAGESAQ